MAQESWNITDSDGFNYQIGLYHGDVSHHLLVYVNGNPIIIEFNIDSKKSFSFMIGNLLYDLHILKSKKEIYSYELKLNQKYFDDIESEKIKEKEIELLRFLIFGAVVLLVIFILRNLY